MKILFAGTNVPNEIEYLTENISAAGNRFQNNMLAYLRKADQEYYNLSFIAPPVGQECVQKLEDIIKPDTYGYILKQDFGSGPIGLIRSVSAFRKALESHIRGTDAVICYNVNYAWLNLPKMAKKHKVKSILILADYSDVDSFRSFGQKLYAKAMKRSICGFDVVVGLSSNVKDIMESDQKYILMEGGIDEAFYHEFDESESLAEQSLKEDKEYRIMYSCLLNKVTGVNQLIEIAEQIYNRNRGFRLVISGKGELSEFIAEKQKESPWLEYLGHLPYSKYIDELKKADLLVNPRNMDLPENANNFPSKVLDYLSAGKPVLSTKFSGWQRFSDVIDFCNIDEWSGHICERYLSNNQAVDYSKKRRAFAKGYLWDKQINRILSEVNTKD